MLGDGTAAAGARDDPDLCDELLAFAQQSRGFRGQREGDYTLRAGLDALPPSSGRGQLSRGVWAH